MDQEQINKKIFLRLDRLEKKVFQDKQKKENFLNDDQKDSLPELILALRKTGFFKKPKTAKEVHEKLSKDYPCDINRVQMALKRLKDKKFLRITSKIVEEKKVLAYVW